MNGLVRRYVKLCDIRDFDDPEVRARIREIAPGLPPEEELHRKYWEYAFLTLFLEDAGKLDERTEAPAVGAGHEAVLFWLANRLGRVVATDIYGEGSFAGGEADATMLSDPDAFAPYPFPASDSRCHAHGCVAPRVPRRGFDAVFSLSSIEHFGGPKAVAQAAREIGRVLRPGGVAFLATECYVSRHPLHSRLLQTAIRLVTRGRLFRTATPARRTDEIFTPEELRLFIVRPSGLELVQPLDRSVSEKSRRNVIRWRGAGQMEPATGKPWPHVMLQASGAPWTSVALALHKPRG